MLLAIVSIAFTYFLLSFMAAQFLLQRELQKQKLCSLVMQYLQDKTPSKDT